MSDEMKALKDQNQELVEEITTAKANKDKYEEKKRILDE